VLQTGKEVCVQMDIDSVQCMTTLRKQNWQMLLHVMFKNCKYMRIRNEKCMSLFTQKSLFLPGVLLKALKLGLQLTPWGQNIFWEEIPCVLWNSESSLPCSRPYHEPVDSTPCLGVLLLYDTVNIIPPTLRSTERFVSFTYSNQSTVRISFLMLVTCAARLSLGGFIALVIFG
jgi:hypothetical protein